jgi:DNA-binding beta-propeller fold protein YncE
VTLVGEDRILVIDVRSRRVERDIRGVGERPRHLVMSPGGRFLYITSEGKDKPHREDGSIIKYDTRRQLVVARSEPLVEPRTTVISDDGRALYVVDYHPGTIVKLATEDLSELQDRYLGFHPIGVTYDMASDKIWVAGYGGQVWPSPVTRRRAYRKARGSTGSQSPPCQTSQWRCVPNAPPVLPM